MKDEKDVKKIRENWNHKFARFESVRSAQIMFERAANKDRNVSHDGCHLKSGMIIETFGEEFLKSLNSYAPLTL